MTKRLSALATLIAIVALGLSTHAAHADDIQATFHASYTDTITSASMTEVIFNGTGRATLLGHSTNSGYAIVTGPGSCAGGFANDDYQTLTAANGDMLTLLSHDVACPVGGGYYHGIGHWVVTGGTGRFRGATGQGDFDGLGHLVQGGQLPFQLTGMIDAPNAD